MCELQSFSAARNFELVWLKVILRLGLTVKFSLTTSDIAYNLFHVGCRGCYGELIYLYPLCITVWGYLDAGYLNGRLV